MVTTSDTDICSICLENMPQNIIKIDCGHTFCTTCFLTYFERNMSNTDMNNSDNDNKIISCPNCRKEVYKTKYHNTRNLDDVQPPQPHIIIVRQDEATEEEHEDALKKLAMIKCLTIVSITLFIWTFYIEQFRR